MIYMTTGRPSSGMTFSSTPPVENSDAPGASGAEDGQGVCTVSPDLALSLRLFIQRQDAIALLDKKRSRLKTTECPEWDAYYWGAKALRVEVDAAADFLRRSGVLLHAGVFSGS